jgi:hypothetical protein
MRITPFGRYGVAMIVLSLVLALGVGRGASSMLLVAAGFFVLAYESMRRPLLEQGLCRTPWFVPRLACDAERVVVEGILLSQTVRFSEITGARLIYQENLDAMVGVDDTLCLQTPHGVVQVARTSDGFDDLMGHLRAASIGVIMVRARAVE